MAHVRALRAGPSRAAVAEAFERPLVLYGLLFAGAVAISAFTIRRGIDPFDEGLTLQAARRVADGELPYRDFLWSYGFAQPLLLAGLFKAFGVSLLSWRILRVLTDAAVAVVVFALVRRAAPLPVALIGWLVAACAMAEPTGAGAAPLALLWGLAAILVASSGPPTVRRGLGAGALVALSAAWRPDFAAYAGAAALVALAVGEGERPERARAAAACLAAAVGLGLLAYLPFAIASSPGRVWDRVVATSVRDHDHWTLPFPFRYHGPLRGWPPGTLAGDLRDALRFYQPLLAVMGVGAAVLAVGLRSLRARSIPPAAAGLLVFAAGGVLYLRSRTDVVHVQVLVVVLAALLPLAAARLTTPIGALLAAVLLLVGINAVANRVSALVSPPTLATISAPTADGVQAPPAEALALSRVVEVIRQRVPPGDPIYVAPRRSDLIKLNDPLVYVLADRDNATGEDFGLLAGDAAQRRIVRGLERQRPRVIVRWTDSVSSEREPNLRGVPSGSRRLDDYLARRYRLLQRLHHYDLLVPRTP